VRAKSVTVEQITASVKQNAALVEESAAAAESLHGQALRLSEALAVYRAAAEQASSARAGQPQRTQSTAKAPLRLAAKAA